MEGARLVRDSKVRAVERQGRNVWTRRWKCSEGHVSIAQDDSAVWKDGKLGLARGQALVGR